MLESMDNGKSIRESRDCDIPIVARHFYHHSGEVFNSVVLAACSDGVSMLRMGAVDG